MVLEYTGFNIRVTMTMAIQSVPGNTLAALTVIFDMISESNLNTAKYHVDNVHEKLNCSMVVLAA